MPMFYVYLAVSDLNCKPCTGPNTPTNLDPGFEETKDLVCHTMLAKST